MKYNQPFDQTNPDAPYVNGNPGAGIQGSIPPAASLEYPQREIVNAITAAGLTPTNGDLTQLWQAMQAAAQTSTSVAYFISQFYATPGTYWRLDSPTVSIPANTQTVLSNYANKIATVHTGTDVSQSSGIVTIGASDAGVYILTATNAVDVPSTEETIILFKGVLGNELASAIAISRGPFPSPGDNANDKSVTAVVRLAEGDKVSAVYLQKNVSNSAANSLNQPLGHFGGVRVAG